MDYSSLTVKKLRQLCQKEGLPAKGNKKELIDGLEQLQKPAMELIAADLPEDDESAPSDDSPLAPAPAAVDTTMAPAPIRAPAPAEAPVMENVSSQPAAATAATAAPVLRASTRVIRPRICTMCVGCHHHPTHAAGRAPRKAAAAPVDEASIVDLAQKFATVNIVPQPPPQEEVEEEGNAPVPEAAVTAKPAAKTTRARTASTTRAPLKAKSNQALEETAAAAEANSKPAKSTKGKLTTTTKKKVVSVKDRAAAAAPETEKENLPSGIDEAKVTTERPGRRTRFVKAC